MDRENLLDQLNGEKFFLPFYQEIVARYPLGIRSRDAKKLVRERIIREYGEDPFDESITGTNESTGDSRASQWANNLVSNHVLDEHMIVVRGSGPVMLYPLTEASNPIPPELPAAGDSGPGDELRDAADDRKPSVSVVKTKEYLRSPALAAYVRRQANFRCITGSPDCVYFTGRDGRRYIEVHHVVPMAEQYRTSFNLDQSRNLVAICPGCHLKLHRGSKDEVDITLRALLKAYRNLHGISFLGALKRCDLGCDFDDLMGYYLS